MRSEIFWGSFGSEIGVGFEIRDKIRCSPSMLTFSSSSSMT